MALEHVELKYCPKCNHAVYLDHDICPQCGYHFTEADDITATTKDNKFTFGMPAFKFVQAKPKFSNAGDAFKSLFNRYFDYGGRSSRSEFWFAQLWWWVIMAFCFGLIVFAQTHTRVEYFFTPEFGLMPYHQPESFALIVGYLGLIIWSLISVIPMVSLLVRRLRDASLSNYWITVLLLAALIPWFSLLAFSIILVFTLMPSMRKIE